jgi:predicted metal-dependent hydrolase
MLPDPPFPSPYLRGLELYDRGDYWESHEALEELWRQVSGVEAGFYRGIIQLDAALIHTQRGHWQGVSNLLRRALTNLRDCPDHFQGLDVARLKRDLQAYLDEVEALRSGQKAEFDWSLKPELRLEPQE